MQPERWKRIEDLFQAAMAKPSDNRTAFLAEACRDDPTLQHEVQSLLSQQANSFLEGSPLSSIADRAGTAGDSQDDSTLDQTMVASGSAPGVMIGPNRLLEIIVKGAWARSG